MKKLVLGIATLAIISTLGFTSCKKVDSKEVSKTEVNKTMSASSTPDVGAVHNAELEYIFQRFNELGNANELSKEEKMNYALKFAQEFNFSDGSTGLQQEAIMQFYQNSNLTVENAISQYSIPVNDRIIKLQSTFSQEGAGMMQQIFDAIDGANTSTDLQEKLSTVSTIINRSSTLPKNERDALTSAVSVATHSWTYWVDDNNASEWSNRIGNQMDMPMGIVKNILRGDCEGAITGAMAGAAAAGVGALAGGMIGAPLGSAWAGLWECF